MQNHCTVGLIKQKNLLFMELDIQYYLALKNMMLFKIGLDIF